MATARLRDRMFDRPGRTRGSSLADGLAVPTPLPLSFLGLAVASTAFSGLELQWIPSTQGWVAAIVALGFTAPLQALTCVFGFLSRDPVAGTGTGVIAATWTVAGVVTLLERPGARMAALGLVLVAAAVVLVVPVVAGLSRPLAAAVMALSGVRFALTGISDLVAGPSWQVIAGVMGLVLAATAVVAALRYELDDKESSWTSRK